jgi:hypothetical protein
LATAVVLAMLVLAPAAMAQDTTMMEDTMMEDTSMGMEDTMMEDTGTSGMGTDDDLPSSGGPAILLPAAALLLGSGILTFAVLRRR